MARRRVKKRTHIGTKNAPAKTASASGPRIPKSMVIRIGAGEVGPSVSQLVKDMRQILEPNTAIKLKERKSNVLRDYTTMCGPLGVTHLLLFSRSTSGNTNMRLAVTPRGPTMHFRVEKYSLCKDVSKSMKHPKTGGYDYQTAPLLIMNNFLTSTTSNSTSESGKPQVPKHLETLVTEVFQNMFPTISPQSTPLASVRRVLLLNREPPHKDHNGTYTINLRHYAIKTKQAGLPKAIRRLNAAEKLIASKERQKKSMPNLGQLEDVADFLLDPNAAAGYTSASESEADTEAEVEIMTTAARKVLSKRDRQRAAAQTEAGKSSGGGTVAGGVERRAVKLIELGPRMKLRLMKIEEDLCEGKVLWHEYITKTKEEIKEMDALWEKKRKEKAERKRIQKENVERKRKEKSEAGGSEDGDMDDYEDYDMDDDEWDEEAEVDDGPEEDEGEDEEMEDEEEG